MSRWIQVAVGLGANLGDREATLRQAADALQDLPQTRCFRFSALFETDAVDCPDPLPFLNATVCFQTQVTPGVMLQQLHNLEARFGRQRTAVNAPRPLDLDLLLYGDAVIEESGLIVPHPRMHQRLFVMEPLSQCMDAQALHPKLGVSFAALTQGCRDATEAGAVRLVRPPDWAVAP